MNKYKWSKGSIGPRTVVGSQQSLFQLTKTVPLETSYHRVETLTVQDNDFASSHVFLGNLARKIANSWPRSREESSEEFLAPYMRMGDQVVNKMRLNRLRWAGYLIRMDEDDPVCKSIRAISMVEKEDEADLV